MAKAESAALRKLPSVDEVLRTAVAADATAQFGRSAVVAAVRETLAATMSSTDANSPAPRRSATVLRTASVTRVRP